MRIQQGADFREAAATTIINVGWIYTVKPRGKLVRHNISLLNRSHLAPADNPGIGLNLDNTFGCAQIDAGRPAITGDEGKVDLMDQDISNLHGREMFPKRTWHSRPAASCQGSAASIPHRRPSRHPRPARC